MTSKKARPSSPKTPASGDSDARTTLKPDGAVFLKWDPKKVRAADMASAMNAVRAAARRKAGLPV
jgi:hypothetical protein